MTNIEDTTYRPDQAVNVDTMGSIAGCNDLPAGGPKYRSMKMKKMKRTKTTDNCVDSVLVGNGEDESLPSVVIDPFLKDIETLSKTKLKEKYPHEFNCHRDMKQRCKNNGYVLHPDFVDFRPFLRIMRPCPDPTYTLDRIDPSNPEYAPNTVQWASKSQQTHNRINTKYLKDSSDTCLSVSEWSRRSGIPGKTIHQRMTAGWSVDEAVTIPVGEPRNLVVTLNGHIPNGYGHEELDLWRRILSDNYHQPVFTPSKAEKGVLKAIVSAFENAGLPPADALESVLVNWHAFCEFAVRHYGAWQEQPEVPTIAYLSPNTTAAANFWATIGKKRQAWERDKLKAKALRIAEEKFEHTLLLADPYASDLIKEIEQAEAVGNPHVGLFYQLQDYCCIPGQFGTVADWETSVERERISKMSSSEINDYLSTPLPPKFRWLREVFGKEW